LRANKLDNIKKILLEYSDDNSGSFYHFTSSLNWLRYINRVNELAAVLPRGTKVLEVGCGYGQVAAMLKALRPDLKIVGSDKIERSGIWKRFKSRGCSYVKCDVKKLPFEDGEFFAVVSFGVMEHVKDDEKFIAETFRILKKGGHNFIFDLPNKYGFSEVVIARIMGRIGRKSIYRHDVRYTKRGVRQLLLKNGFADIDIKNEFLIPAQVNRVNNRLGEFFNKNYLLLDEIDKFLIKTPLASIAQTLSIHCKKP